MKKKYIINAIFLTFLIAVIPLPLLAGSLEMEYSTYLGGGNDEQGQGIAVSNDSAYVVGYTWSSDFPTVNPYQASSMGEQTSALGGSKDPSAFQKGSYDVFVSKLSSDGSALAYSTYLGGEGDDRGYGIVVLDGIAYLTGETNSSGDSEMAPFPAVNSFQENNAGGYDAFVTKISSSGSFLIYSTYLGGEADDQSRGIAVADNSVYLIGTTGSFDFPTVNPYQASFMGEQTSSSNLVKIKGGEGTKEPGDFVIGARDVFVSKLSSTGSSLVYSTYLGGGGIEYGSGIAVSSGTAYLIGYTGSTDFPTRNAYQSLFAGGKSDAFVSRLDSTGSALVYSTYLGGGDGEFGSGIAVADDSAYLIGATASLDFPTVNPYQASFMGEQTSSLVRISDTGERGSDKINRVSQDVFVSRLASSGSALIYSTYLGGDSNDNGLGIAVRADSAYLIGYTGSTNFPTVNPYQAASMGEQSSSIGKLILSKGDSKSPEEDPISVKEMVQDVFVSRLASSGSALIYSTYLGGDSNDEGRGIAVWGNAVYVTGSTGSINFPTKNSYQGINGGREDVFVSKLFFVVPPPDCSDNLEITIFPKVPGGWTIREGSRIYWGDIDDLPVTGK